MNGKMISTGKRDTPGTRFQAALCDGSVRTVSCSSEIAIYTRLGNRDDGAVIDVSNL